MLESSQSIISTTSDSSDEKVYGILGLEPTSHLVLNRILSDGHRCIVWDPELLRGSIKIKNELVSIASTPGEVVRNSGVTFSCVDFDPKLMIHGTEGVLQYINNTKGYVEMSNIDQACSKEISASIEHKGGWYLEAQTVYFPGLLEKAKGITLMAGNQSLSYECAPFFEFTSSDTYYLGHVGLASIEKTLISSLCNTVATVLDESFRLAQNAGLNVKDFAEMAKLCLNAQMGPVIKMILNKGEFPLQKMVKDQQHMQREASNFSVPIPVIATATQSLLAKLDQKNVDTSRTENHLFISSGYSDMSN